MCFSANLVLNGQVALLDTLSTFSTEEDKLEYLSYFFSSSIYSEPAKAPIYAAIFDSISINLNQPKYTAKAHAIKGMSHYVNGRYDESIDEYVAALELADYLTDSFNKARLLNSLATSYQIREDLENSLKFYVQAHEIFLQEKDSLWVANTSGNIGLLLLNNKEVERAEPFIRTALEFYQENGHSTYEGYTSLNLGNLLVEKEEFKQSIDQFDRAIELVSETVNPLVSAAANSGKGVAYNHLNQYDNSEKFLLIGLEKSTKINLQDQLSVCHLELSKLYEKKKFYSKSLSHFKTHSSLKDSLFTLKQDAKMVEALTKYETDLKEKEINLLNSEKILVDTKLSNSKRISFILSFGLLLLIGLLYWLYRLYKENKENADAKDTLLREIHHRVKNNLQVISALLTLQSKFVKDDHAIEALQAGQDRVQSMALIHRDLYQHDNLKGVNTKDYLEKLITNLLSSYNINKEQIALQLNIESIWLDVDTMIPLGLMINELVSNALKHAFKNQNNGVLRISLKELNNIIFLEVADNGIGMAISEIQKNGNFGKSLIDSFSKKLKADISYENNQGLSIALKIKEYKKAS